MSVYSIIFTNMRLVPTQAPSSAWSNHKGSDSTGQMTSPTCWLSTYGLLAPGNLHGTQHYPSKHKKYLEYKFWVKLGPPWNHQCRGCTRPPPPPGLARAWPGPPRCGRWWRRPPGWRTATPSPWPPCPPCCSSTCGRTKQNIDCRWVIFLSGVEICSCLTWDQKDRQVFFQCI